MRVSGVDMLKLLWKKGFLFMRPTWKGSISFGLVYIPGGGLSSYARGED
jgi:hypothetical protein